MSKIKIKNFGPIKEGFVEEGGWMDIKKVTVFIGNQGSGKSTIAKLFSTLSWMEKAINRGDLDKGKITFDEFDRICSYQGIKNYILPDTEIEYIGGAYAIRYDKKENSPIITKIVNHQYTVPKIMYVPAERNFLTTIENAYDVKGLPGPLFTFGEELRRAQRELKGEVVDLPINSYKYKYDINSGISTIIGNDHTVNLLEASSGIQSSVPLYIVSKNLSTFIVNDGTVENLSLKQSIRKNDEVVKVIEDKSLSIEDKKRKVNQIILKYNSKCFINIVEEPEQNLYPSSQRHVLNSLLEFNNKDLENILIITTHSPYIINYITLAVKAESLLDISINYKGESDFKTVVSKIVPWNSMVKASDLAIYELDEKTGTIKKLEVYNGLPSDENKLNDELGDSNELFATLLEIEQQL